MLFISKAAENIYCSNLNKELNIEVREKIELTDNLHEIPRGSAILSAFKSISYLSEHLLSKDCTEKGVGFLLKDKLPFMNENTKTNRASLV